MRENLALRVITSAGDAHLFNPTFRHLQANNTVINGLFRDIDEDRTEARLTVGVHQGVARLFDGGNGLVFAQKRIHRRFNGPLWEGRVPQHSEFPNIKGLFGGVWRRWWGLRLRAGSEENRKQQQ